MPAQYGEDAIFTELFKGHTGLVVEVGAADGVTHSNSNELIKQGWTGVLIEPMPQALAEMERYYMGLPELDVWVDGHACGTREGKETFYVNGQVSSLCPVWRDRCIDVYGLEFEEVSVDVKRLDNILKWYDVPSQFDLLSIDCEGRDMDVLASMSFDLYQPRVICIEAKGALIQGYTVHAKTSGNTIYMRDE